MEPGEIIKRFATEAHPFSALPDLDNFRKRIVAYKRLPDETILRECQRALEYWKARAQALRSKSLSRLFGITDCDLRDYHFKDCPSGLNSPVGTFCHVELWQEMVEALGLPDRKFVKSLVQGFPLMGPIQESDCWPKLDPSHPLELLEAHLHTRAWDIRKKVIDKVRREKGGGLAAEVWKDSLSDVDKGFALGPFYHFEQLNEKLGTEQWIPMPRFGIKQGSKVRVVDDASVSGSSANSWSSHDGELTSAQPGRDHQATTCGASPLGWMGRGREEGVSTDCHSSRPQEDLHHRRLRPHLGEGGLLHHEGTPVRHDGQRLQLQLKSPCAHMGAGPSIPASCASTFSTIISASARTHLRKLNATWSRGSATYLESRSTRSSNGATGSTSLELRSLSLRSGC